MEEILTIKKEPNLKSSQNYALLKEAGLKHIESLSSYLWTDYNEHDPGITLMEVLAYAITDLGYRTGYDVKDLITPREKALAHHNDTFHKAAEILPCNQVTELDLREILIDIKGVRNAWIKIASKFENTYFVDYSGSKLSLTDPAVRIQEEVTDLNGLYHIVVEFDRLEIPLDHPSRAALEKSVLAQARERLMQYRNFCEDYFIEQPTINLTRDQVTKVVTKPTKFENIVVWADVEVLPESDMEKVHAQVYFAIEQFLIPYVSFYSLKERLKSGKTIDEIFEGPLLEHGFIDEEELEKIELVLTIHTSDLYQVIMDVPGVKSVKSMKIANYETSNGIEHVADPAIENVDGDIDYKKLLTKGKEWCLELSTNPATCEFYELVLNTVTNSPLDPVNKTIKFYTGENSVPVSLQTSKTFDELQLLRENDRKRRERLRTGYHDLNVPEGEHLEVDQYYPVQNELPLVYGTGLSGLPENVTTERKAQAAQLKAFMLLFEQILANYLSQLNNVRNLFSWDDTIDKTYFTQLVSNIKDRDKLYLEKFDGSNLAPGGVLDETALKNLLQNDAENASVYYDRRSRFLNHLIARFNEKFVDYTMIMHSLQMKDRTIPDKAKFLKEYDLISMNRGKGFNFAAMRSIPANLNGATSFEPEVWDTENVTGYQHRLSRFLGLCDIRRRFLYSGHDVIIEAKDFRVALGAAYQLKYRYVLTVDAASGLKIYGSYHLSESDAINQFDNLIENEGKDNVAMTPTLGGAVVPTALTIKIDGTNNLLGTTDVFNNLADLGNAITTIENYFNDVTAFVTEIVNIGGGKWKFTLEITTATPTFLIEGCLTNGTPFNSENEAKTKLATFLQDLKDDKLSFGLPPDHTITNNEFLFEITSLGVLVAKSERTAFVQSKDAAAAGMAIAESFLNDSIGYKNSEGGLHVVEHILLRPKTDNMSLLPIDVKEFDATSASEKPLIAYPADYSGIYNLDGDEEGPLNSDGTTPDVHTEQYFLTGEVELIDVSENANGELVVASEPYLYTYSAGDNEDSVSDTNVHLDDFLLVIRGGDVKKFVLKPDSPTIHKENWTRLMDNALGSNFSNYRTGEVTTGGKKFHYYFIVDVDAITTEEKILGGLVMLDSGVLNETAGILEQRMLRTLAYFSKNTSCNGIANPYEFRATVIIPSWTARAVDYNYRAYAEEMARLEAPAHVAIDVKWVGRAEMREFEVCYRSWLMRQGEYLNLVRRIESAQVAVTNEAAIADNHNPPLVFANPTNLSNALVRATNASKCLIEKLGKLKNQFQTTYKTVSRNDQYFTNPGSLGSVLAWIADPADSSEVNKAEIVGGILPSFLGFFDGENFQGGTMPIPAAVQAMSFNPGDFMTLTTGIVPAIDHEFSVKTYSNTGQVSCTTFTISIFSDQEASYTGHDKCWNHFEGGDIIAEIEDNNGLISSAIVQAGGLPIGLKLLLNNADLTAWAALRGHPAGNYQPGDIVVDAAIGNFPLLKPINDTGAIGNEVVAISVLTTDITGGTTLFANVPLKAYGALPPIAVTNNGRYVESFRLGNLIYANYPGTVSDILITLENGHHAAPANIPFVNVAPNRQLQLLAPLGKGLNARLNASGRVEIFVSDYNLFHTYVQSLVPNGSGVVTIPGITIRVFDGCDFQHDWTGSATVIQNRTPQVVPVTSPCSDVAFNAVLTRVSDADLGVHAFSLDPAVLANLTSIGIIAALDGANPQKLIFKVNVPATFLNAVTSSPLFGGQTTINGILVKTYTFPVSITDKTGKTQTINVEIRGPVNEPFTCDFVHPSGTSKYAFVYSSLEWIDAWGYKITQLTQTVQLLGKTVVEFNDPNGIRSISCSCLNCNNQPFTNGAFDVFTDFNVYDTMVDLVTDDLEYFQITTPYKVEEPARFVKSDPGKKSNQRKSRSGENIVAIKNDRVNAEKYINKFANKAYTEKIPKFPQSNPCQCLEDWGMSLDTVNHKIHVTNGPLFMTKAKGLKRLSIRVTDNCGVTTCKEISLNFGDDHPAYYVYDKNNKTVNSYKNGDLIAHLEDPEGIKTVQLAYLVPPSPPLYMTYFVAVNSNSDAAYVLPPGVAFNKTNGDVIVSIKSKNTVADKIDKIENKAMSPNLPDAKAAGKKMGTPVFKKFGKSNENGDMHTTKGSPGFEINGNALLKSAAGTNVTAMNGALTTINGAGISVVDGFGLSPSNLLKHEGALVSGEWTFYVITTDNFGGVTAVPCTIKIKENTKFDGVLDSIGIGKFTDVKGVIKTNYANVLKLKDTAAKVETEVPLIGNQAAVKANTADLSITQFSKTNTKKSN